MPRTVNIIALADALRDQRRRSAQDAPAVAVLWEATYPEFRYEFVTHAAEALLGYPRVAWTQEAEFWARHVHPDDLEVAQVRRRESISSNDRAFEYRMLDANGDTVWVQDVVHTVRDAEGHPTRCHGVLLDITTRKKSDLLLRDTEQKFRAAITQSPYMVVLSRLADSTILYVNDASFGISGYRPDEIIGRSALEIFWTDPVIRDKFTADLRENGRVNERTIEFQIKTGGKIMASISAALTEIDGEPCVVTTARDISDQWRRDVLQERVNRAMRILAASNRALVTIDDMRDLLQAISEIIVTEAGYDLCTAVYERTNGPERGYEVIARAGISGFLPSGSSPAEDGPITAAIRTGSTTAIAQISSYDRSPQWRANAIAEGVNSVVCIPLTVDEARLGAVAIWSCESNGFNSVEIEVLEKLVGSIAFRIAAIRSRQRQLDAERALRQANIILRGIHRAQSTYISARNRMSSFEQLLDVIVELSGSSFGYVIEVVNDLGERPLLKATAIVDRHATAALKPVYASLLARAESFDPEGSILATVVRSGQTLIINEPGRCGQALGNGEVMLEFTSFMGIPLWRGGQMIGVVGIGNRAHGYQPVQEFEVESLLLTCGNMIDAYRNEQNRREAEELLAIENRMLAIINQARPLGMVLDEIALTIETLMPDMRATIFAADRDCRYLRMIAAPTLFSRLFGPESLVPIGEGVGNCGTAAFRREVVIASDILTDRNWVNLQEVAKELRVRACWSVPLIAGDGTLLGTFAMYFDQPRKPTPFDRQLLGRLGAVVTLALTQFKSQFEQLPAPRAVVDQTGTILHANYALQTILGMTDVDLIGATIESVFGRDQDVVTWAAGTQTRPGITPYSFQHEWHRTDGTTFWLRGTVLPIVSPGQDTHYIVQFEDISNERRAATLERQSIAVFEHATVEMFLIDAATLEFVAANKRARDKTGYCNREIRRMKAADVIPGQTTETLLAKLAPMREGRVPVYTFSGRHRCRNGSVREVAGAVFRLDLRGQQQLMAAVYDRDDAAAAPMFEAYRAAADIAATD
ncbi:MAG: PAS domain S-box protein [Gammaproteobacteria bacterium]|nr:PAS domain S-box protein [Gammaproteobacteria bacterium]